VFVEDLNHCLSLAPLRISLALAISLSLSLSFGHCQALMHEICETIFAGLAQARKVSYGCRMSGAEFRINIFVYPKQIVYF